MSWMYVSDACGFDVGSPGGLCGNESGFPDGTISATVLQGLDMTNQHTCKTLGFVYI